MHKAIDFIKKESWLLAYYFLFTIGICSIAVFMDLTNIGFWISLVFLNFVKDCGEYKALTEILEKNDEQIKEAGVINVIFKHLFLGLLAIYFIFLAVFPTGFSTNDSLGEGIPFSAGEFYIGLSIFSILIHYASYRMTLQKENLIRNDINPATLENGEKEIIEEKDIVHAYESIKEHFTEEAAKCVIEWVSMNVIYEKTARKTEYPLMFKSLEISNETVLFFPDFPEFATIIKSTNKEDILDSAKDILLECIRIYKENNRILPWASEEKSVKELTGVNNIIMISSTGGNDE